jgi:secreted PhoX family phosphatase
VTPPTLVPTADLADNATLRLAVPPGFQYRSFDRTGVGMANGTVPGNHDGMAAFQAGNGRSLLIRNHEINGSTGAFVGDGPVYDPAAPGGNTYVLVGPNGVREQTWGALRGTQMNCAGGPMPWGSWITCEETVNGRDVFDDFTRNIPPNTAPDGEFTFIQNARLQREHGYIFEVPVNGAASAEPIRSAGRFAHEAAAFDPQGGGALYLTEDDFGFGSGFFRYDPPVNPRRAGRLEDGGTLWMLAVDGMPQANLSGDQTGASYRTTWVQIDPADADPSFGPIGAPVLTNNQAIHWVTQAGWDKGGAVFSRLEGVVYDKGVVYFTATQGGGAPEVVDWENSAETQSPSGFGNGTGQVWAYDSNKRTLTCVYQSTGPTDLRLPDNVTASPRGTLILCEDHGAGATGPNSLQALTRWGQLFPIVDHVERPGVEFAGSTFSHDGRVLFFNLNTGSALTVAMWGPWEQIGI